MHTHIFKEGFFKIVYFCVEFFKITEFLEKSLSLYQSINTVGGMKLFQVNK